MEEKTYKCELDNPQVLGKLHMLGTCISIILPNNL